MTTKRESLKHKIERLRNSFYSELPTRMDEILLNFHRLELHQDNVGVAKELHRKIHNIKGTAASFGLKEISEIAIQVEPLLKNIIETLCIDESALEEIHDLILQLKSKSEEIINLNSMPRDIFPAFEISSDNSEKSNKDVKQLIYICDDDEMLLEQMRLQLDCYNYSTQIFSSATALYKAAELQCPGLIIMDIVFPDGDREGLDIINKLQSRNENKIPVIFISARNDFQARLYAVEAGGIAYFNKPFPIMALVDSIDKLLFTDIPDPYRVLIIDDDVDMSQYHSLILQEAGISVEIVNQEENALKHLFDFSPDLILMDMYMPLCTGAQLAQVIRQIPDFVSLPIVYLSSETDNKNQFSALRVGADGFLTKPIDPDRLISEVLLRTERMKVIRTLMVSDSLTGLLNHTTILHSLDIAMHGADRRNETLGFVMIDIDFFKKVNDRYGHSAGDQVILALSRLLKQRMRKSDYVGRYGGEEFALVLTDVQPVVATKIVNDFRKAFEALEFNTEQGVFSCTLSAGLSFFPEFSDRHELVNSADEALYKAKNSGRNCVVTYTDELSKNLNNAPVEENKNND